MFEEVNMPPTQKAPVDVGKERVLISSLDQVSCMLCYNNQRYHIHISVCQMVVFPWEIYLLVKVQEVHVMLIMRSRVFLEDMSF